MRSGLETRGSTWTRIAAERRHSVARDGSPWILADQPGSKDPKDSGRESTPSSRDAEPFRFAGQELAPDFWFWETSCPAALRALWLDASHACPSAAPYLPHTCPPEPFTFPAILHTCPICPRPPHFVHLPRPTSISCGQVSTLRKVRGPPSGPSRVERSAAHGGGRQCASRRAITTHFPS